MVQWTSSTYFLFYFIFYLVCFLSQWKCQQFAVCLFWNITASSEQMHLNTGLLVKWIIHKCSCREAKGIWTRCEPGKTAASPGLCSRNNPPDCFAQYIRNGFWLISILHFKDLCKGSKLSDLQFLQVCVNSVLKKHFKGILFMTSFSPIAEKYSIIIKIDLAWHFKDTLEKTYAPQNGTPVLTTWLQALS